jgi:protein ImuB
MLWLALSIPALPLAVFERGSPEPAAAAVADKQHLLIVNDAALAAGVRHGMKLTAARTLSPELRIRPCEPAREDRALRQLAAWALQFTPLVSLQPPNGLLLEIGGSLRLFGGLERLRARLCQGLAALGYDAVVAVAPTPTAAWLLACAGDQQPVDDAEDLPERLRALPLTVLTLDARRQQALAGLGLRTIGDCLALPRAGLARRFGAELLAQLDRALGTAADPRRPYLPPPRFDSRIELPADAEGWQPLLFPLRRMLDELGGFLRGLDSGIQRLELVLEHAGRGDTKINIGLVEPDRDPDRLLKLCQERLQYTELPAPVRGLTLRTDKLQPYIPDAPVLLADHGRPQHLWTHLIERLYARLGDSALQSLATCSEHRPERAWAYVPPGQSRDSEAHPERPLWLLPTPLPLRLRDRQPIWHGPLVLRRGPERIETGWWDGDDVRRDYYVAENPQGARVWVFREHRNGDWFLHGIFG